jgi:hypothetical protein
MTIGEHLRDKTVVEFTTETMAITVNFIRTLERLYNLKHAALPYLSVQECINWLSYG